MTELPIGNNEEPPVSTQSASERAEESWGAEQVNDLDNARKIYFNVVNNNFNDEVDASSANFGATGPGRAGRRATGRLDPADIDAALRWFVPPPAFESAVRTLRERRLVVLVGADGCGRRAGALALVRGVVGDRGPIISMSPAWTFAELAGQTFQRGRGYLVQDHLGDAESSAVREFEVAGLAEQLAKAGAYLVITATPVVVADRSLRSFAVSWRAPDPVRLFDECAAEVDVDPAVLDTARTYAGRLLAPHEVVGLVRRLVDDPVHALDTLGESAREQVTAWFDARPGKRAVLAIAALAFLHRVPERIFEGGLARLSRLASDEQEPADALPQRRFELARSHPLVTAERITVAGAGGPVTERAVAFHSARHRELVIAELYDKYGYELWEPLRRWLDEVAASPAPAARVELALGMSLLARVSFGEVAEFLDRWADGAAAERSTAAITLWWMCPADDDSLAPTALRSALRWVRDRGQHRAITAAMALGGDLGLRYPSEALRWLWFLAHRTERIGIVARLSIAFLFSAGVADADSSTAMLVRARRAFRITVNDDVDQRGVRAVRQTVVALLRATREGVDEPAVVTVVRQHPDGVPVLGALWAAVLSSGPHRREAFDALVDCLVAMAHDPRPEAHDHVRRLGRAVLGELSGWHRQLLRRDLLQSVREGPVAARPPRDLVAVLLSSLDP